jgi:hypothetical protein
LVSQISIPVFVFMTKSTMTVMAEAVTRFSYALQRKQKGRLLSLTQITSPWVSDLQITEIGGAPYVCGEISDGNLVPIPALGDGTLTLLSIGMAIIQAEGGAVLLDEFDTAIHFSRLKIVWREIAKLANEFNCQIFAATHSRECISAASEGLAEAGLFKDLQYIRLDRAVDGETTSVLYSAEELTDALAENWEVR